MIPEPKWGDRSIVQHNVGSTWIVVDRKEAHGWYRRWNLVQYNQDQFVTIPVLDQDFITATPGVNQVYTSKASFNANHNWVECIGGGGAGAKGATATSSGGGGGGGAYNITLNGNWFPTPGTSTTTVRVGSAGTALGTFPQSGGDSWVGSTSIPASGLGVAAKGGTSPATNTTSTNGTGGATASGFPTVSPPAFAGGNGTTTPANGTTGSGGGGAAGPYGIGANAATTSGGSADGGRTAGGAGGSPGAVGVQGIEWVSSFGSSSGGGGGNASPSTAGAGTSYGGGGGGGAGLGTGGSGGQGLVIVSWVVKEPQSPTANPPLFKSIIAR